MLKIPFGFVVWPPAGFSQLPSACQSLLAHPASRQPCATAALAAPCTPPRPAVAPSSQPGAPRPTSRTRSPFSNPSSEAKPAHFPLAPAPELSVQVPSSF